jgi:hypothetical protein
LNRAGSLPLTSQEGYAASRFPVLVPAKRRRNCYRVDEEQMIVEVTNGRSEIYDILTHLTFMFMEADKIRRHAFHERGGMTREWEKLEAIIKSGGVVEEDERELALTYVSTILGRTFAETVKAYMRFQENPTTNSGLFEIVYGLGKTAMGEESKGYDREISFTPPSANASATTCTANGGPPASNGTCSKRAARTAPAHHQRQPAQRDELPVLGPGPGQKPARRRPLRHCHATEPSRKRQPAPPGGRVRRRKRPARTRRQLGHEHPGATHRHGPAQPQEAAARDCLQPRLREGAAARDPGDGLRLRRTGLRDDGRTAQALQRRRRPSSA